METTTIINKIQTPNTIPSDSAEGSKWGRITNLFVQIYAFFTSKLHGVLEHFKGKNLTKEQLSPEDAKTHVITRLMTQGFFAEFKQLETLQTWVKSGAAAAKQEMQALHSEYLHALHSYSGSKALNMLSDTAAYFLSWSPFTAPVLDETDSPSSEQQALKKEMHKELSRNAAQVEKSTELKAQVQTELVELAKLNKQKKTLEKQLAHTKREAIRKEVYSHIQQMQDIYTNTQRELPALKSKYTRMSLKYKLLEAERDYLKTQTAAHFLKQGITKKGAAEERMLLTTRNTRFDEVIRSIKTLGLSKSEKESLKKSLVKYVEQISQASPSQLKTIQEELISGTEKLFLLQRKLTEMKTLAEGLTLSLKEIGAKDPLDVPFSYRNQYVELKTGLKALKPYDKKLAKELKQTPIANIAVPQSNQDSRSILTHELTLQTKLQRITKRITELTS